MSNGFDPEYIERRTVARNIEWKKEAVRQNSPTRTIFRLIRELFWKGRK